MSVRIWSDGEVVSETDATVPLTGDAVLRGVSVFEGIMAYRQPGLHGYAVISLASHIARLQQSASLMRLPTDRLAEMVSLGIRALLSGEIAKQVYLRPTLYLRHGYYGGESETALFVSARAVEPPGGRPFDCIISTLRHIPPDSYPHEAKIGAMYAFYRLSRMEAGEAGADEAILLTTDGSVSETPGASIFAISDNIAYTPSVSVGILTSITRATAIDMLTARMGIKVIEQELSPEFLLAADEVFLTGTMDEIRPVRSIDKQTIGTCIAPITLQLRNNYLQACQQGQPEPPPGTEFFEGSQHGA